MVLNWGHDCPLGVFGNSLRHLVKGVGCKARDVSIQQITLLPNMQIMLPLRNSRLDKSWRARFS